MSFDLNLAQAKAVEHEEGSAIIIAGAGTGKTRVITQRIIRLIEKQKCKPENILALTFTEKAAQEMQERIDLEMPLSFGEVKIRTFHAFCKDILVESGLEMGFSSDFTLMDEISSWLFLRENLLKLKLDYYRPLGNPTKFVAALNSYFSRLKEEDISPAEYLEYAENLEVQSIFNASLQAWEEERAQKKRKTKKEPPLEEFQKEAELVVKKERELAKAYQIYEEILINAGKLDFGGLIYQVLQLFRQRPNVLAEYQKHFQYVLVDEFQDTNYAQNELVEMLVAKHDNLMVVGDDDQAIYKFRGASLSNILQFEAKHPDCEQFVLTENYRCSQNILDLAYQSIQYNNPHRLEVKLGLEKKLIAKGTVKEEKIKIWHFQDDLQEAEDIVKTILTFANNPDYSLNSIAILVRSKALADVILAELDRQGLPYRFVGNRGLFLQTEIKDLINFLTVLTEPDNDMALFGLMQSSYFDFKQIDLVRYLQAARKKNWSLFEYLEVTKNQELEVGREQGELFKVMDPDGVKPQDLGDLMINDGLDSGQLSLEEATGMKNKLEIIENNSTLQVTNFLIFIKKLIEDSKTISVGQILWDFLKKMEIEKRLVQMAEAEGMEKSQMVSGNLQEFFRKITEFERNSEDKTSVAFMDYLEAQLEAGDNPKTAEAEAGIEAVQIMTIHGSKGLEFETVFLPGLVQNKFPAQKRSDTIILPDELVKEIDLSEDFHTEEERRLFYVALTRAKKNLYLSYAESYNGGTRKWKKSLFLEELISSSLEESEITQLELKSFEQESEVLDKLDAKFHTPDLSKIKLEVGAENFNHIISFSQLSTYETCPKKYHYRYILHIPSPGGVAAHFGSSVHDALKDFYREMKKKGQIPYFESLKMYLQKNWISSGYRNKVEEMDYFVKAEKMLEEFYNSHQGKWVTPTYIEEPFRIRLYNQEGEHVLISGRIDRIDEIADDEYEVIDYKTGSFNQNVSKEMQKNLQLSIYAIATRELLKINSTKFSLLFLKDGHQISTSRNTEDLIEAKKKIWQIVDQIKSNQFKPKPSEIMCSFCDYKRICPNAVL